MTNLRRFLQGGVYSQLRVVRHSKFPLPLSEPWHKEHHDMCTEAQAKGRGGASYKPAVKCDFSSGRRRTETALHFLSTRCYVRRRRAHSAARLHRSILAWTILLGIILHCALSTSSR